MESVHQPCNTAAEAAVMSNILGGLHPHAVAQARGVLTHPLFFGTVAFRPVWLAILEMDDLGLPVDRNGVCDWLMRLPYAEAQNALAAIDRRQRERLLPWSKVTVRPVRDLSGTSTWEAVDGQNLFKKLKETAPQSAIFPRNLTLICDNHIKRSLRTHLLEAAEAACSNRSVADVISTVNATVSEVHRSHLPLEITTVRDIKRRLVEQADTASQRQGTLAPPWPALSRYLETVRPGGLYLLAARPGVGKTSFAISMSSAWAKRGATGIVFSLEVQSDDLVRKSLSPVIGRSFREIEMAGRPQLEAWLKATDDEADARTYVSEQSRLSITGIKNSVTRLICDGKRPDYILIDYLQLMVSDRDDTEEYERVSEISRGLKILAKEARCPIIALSQMSRDSEKGVLARPREPRLSDLRGSGSLEQDADVVVFLHEHARSDDAEGDQIRKIKCIVAKNRFGGQGDAWFDFRPKTMVFDEGAAPAPTAEDEVQPRQRRYGRALADVMGRGRAGGSGDEDVHEGHSAQTPPSRRGGGAEREPEF